MTFLKITFGEKYFAYRNPQAEYSNEVFLKGSPSIEMSWISGFFNSNMHCSRHRMHEAIRP
jgi:hypothetical protein